MEIGDYLLPILVIESIRENLARAADTEHSN